MDKLNQLLGEGDDTPHPVLIIGGGRVGRAAAAALKQRGVAVHVVDKNPARKKVLSKHVDRLIIGDAADRGVLSRAGLTKAAAVALTTNDDAVNVHLTVYCRRLKPSLNIVTRITHHRNIESIYRAGARLGPELHDPRPGIRHRAAARPPAGDARRGRRLLPGRRAAGAGRRKRSARAISAPRRA